MSFSNINYNLYKTFIAVYETKNMSRASKELFIGQPNVSRNIKELEKCLDVKLFHSNPRGVEPTNEAIELYNKVAPAFAWVDYGERNVNVFNEESAGVIKIAVATTFAGYALSPYMVAFIKRYTEMKFDIINTSAYGALELLETRKVDLVLSTLELDKKNNFGLEAINLWDLKETYFASEEFAKQNNLESVISKEQFDKLPYVAHRSLEFRKNPTAIVDSQEMVFQLVKNGFGVGLCLEQFLNFNHVNDRVFKFRVESHKFAEPFLHCLYCKDYLTKAAKAFLELLRQNRIE